jgi:hypothetical protein
MQSKQHSALDLIFQGISKLSIKLSHKILKYHLNNSKATSVCASYFALHGFCLMKCGFQNHKKN